MTLRLLPIAAAGALMLMALAQSTPGTPLPNILIGLEPQSGGTALTATTAGSNAEAVIAVPAGIYSVFVANGSSLPGPALLTVIEGSQQRISGTIPRAAGRVYAPNASGPGRMMVNSGGQNGPVRLRLATAQAPVFPTCLTLANGAPRIVTAQGSATGTGGGLNGQAMAAARANWSAQARTFNLLGQVDYSDWSRATQTNVSSSSAGSPFNPTITVTLRGQPCR
ncbi:MAG: hypothetical protein K2Y04_13260 [Caulobacteraceae bacterium]|nr:hypothetical protein [Caulobacteraceae bacterium]